LGLREKGTLRAKERQSKRLIRQRPRTLKGAKGEGTAVGARKDLKREQERGREKKRGGEILYRLQRTHLDGTKKGKKNFFGSYQRTNKENLSTLIKRINPVERPQKGRRQQTNEREGGKKKGGERGVGWISNSH